MKSVPMKLNVRLAAAVQARWQTFRRALKRCRQKFATKAVHECRVEARRLLSTLELLQSIVPQERFRKGRRPVRRCLKLLQPLRDVQVQENLARQSAITSLPLIRRELAKQRHRYRKKAMRGIKALELARTKELTRQMERDLGGTAVENGRRDGRRIALRDDAALRRLFLKRLTGLYRKVIGLRKEIDPGNVETIHRLRIAFKKFRYTVEPLRGFMTEFPPESMRDIKSLQEALGGLQDTDVYLRWLDKVIRHQPEMVRPLAFFRHWLLCLRPQQIRASIHWIDQLPAYWQGGPFQFTSGEGSKRERNGLGGRQFVATSNRARMGALQRERTPRGPSEQKRKRGRRTARARSAGPHPAV
ncbi:MAG TPA: CHAD domain-containing protein [Verrucomicrobiae bacterium]|nr:CHAD domain-containing protein [Verrucomicrobiae bacterium]